MRIIFEVDNDILKWKKDLAVGGESVECSLTIKNIDELLDRTKDILYFEVDYKMKFDEIAFTKALNAIKKRKCTLIGNEKCIGLECGSIIAVQHENQEFPGLYCLFSYLMDEAKVLIKKHGYEVVSIKGKELYFGEGD